MGGLLTDAPDTPAGAGDGAAVLRTPGPVTERPPSAGGGGGAAAAAPAAGGAAPLLPPRGVKLAVLKYGTGGVAAQIAARPEIVKFMCARGTRAIVDLHNASGGGGGGNGGPPPPLAAPQPDSQPGDSNITPARDAAALQESQPPAGGFGADE